MWTPFAEVVVLKLIAGLTADELDPIRTHAARLGALPIGGNLWVDYYLRPNGEFVTVGEDLDRPEADRVYTDRASVLTALVWGARRYPELKQLLPVREPGARDCRCRAIPMFAEGKVVCNECSGLGWLPVQSAE